MDNHTQLVTLENDKIFSSITVIRPLTKTASSGTPILLRHAVQDFVGCTIRVTMDHTNASDPLPTLVKQLHKTLLLRILPTTPHPPRLMTTLHKRPTLHLLISLLSLLMFSMYLVITTLFVTLLLIPSTPLLDNYR